MSTKRAEIFQNLAKGLLIENKEWNLVWDTPLCEMINLCETSREENKELPWLNFGKLIILNGIELNLCTPFDTIGNNNNSKRLNHVGQNINLEDVDSICSRLISILGLPDDQSDSYGTYRAWQESEYYIKVIPRFAHGDEWSSIIIGKEKTHNTV
jgi:hypothetical protein